ncbi:hypothetical protein EYY86_09495 [Hafnia paralvei]|nr:hypothetical protein EYY86_09495 [Hafnia paralvei]
MNHFWSSLPDNPQPETDGPARHHCTSLSLPVSGRTAPDIAGYISICASYSLLSPLAFSGQALLPLVTPYPFRPFSLAGTGRNDNLLLHQRQGQNPMSI